MTTLDNTRLASSGMTIGGIFNSVIGTIVDWNDARVTRKALSSLTARELDDIGLCYSDIDTIAAGGVVR